MLFDLKLNRLEFPLILFRDILYLSPMHFFIDPDLFLKQLHLLVMLLQTISLIVMTQWPFPVV